MPCEGSQSAKRKRSAGLIGKRGHAAVSAAKAMNFKRWDRRFEEILFVRLPKSMNMTA
jgi:hypothetical protein